jgi:hypothetical protein
VLTEMQIEIIFYVCIASDAKVSVNIKAYLTDGHSTIAFGSVIFIPYRYGVLKGVSCNIGR